MGLMFYRFFIASYGFVLRLAAFFNAKARLFVAGRAGTFDVLGQQMANRSEPLAWFHCASLGEFEQGRPIIEAFKQEFPAYKILLSFFSPSGYEVRKNYPLADYVHYLPLDTQENAAQWVDLVNPKIAFFIKYEFWHFYIRAMAAKNIPVLSVSSIFRADQVYFRPWGAFQRKILRNVTHFFVQDKNSEDLLKKISIAHVSLAGDTRFDRVFEICQKAAEIEGVAKFANPGKVMVIGSCWPEDMDILYPFIQANELKYIVAPHEISAKFIAEISQKVGRKTTLFSMGPQAWPGNDVLIIDNIGMLSRLYQYADYAYVGGAFGKGLHNILEAATFGIPIFFGNKSYTRFKEAVELKEQSAAFAVGSYQELQGNFDSLNQGKNYATASRISSGYVKNNTGATARVIRFTKELQL